jgi:hypothetical protein
VAEASKAPTETAKADRQARSFIAGNEHPGRGTIATVRRRFVKRTGALFVEVLKSAREMA